MNKDSAIKKSPQTAETLGFQGAPTRRRFSTAPMMDWSDKHCRFFWRLLSKNAFLYTEMVTTGAVIHGNTDRFLQYNDEEHPVALQLGGSNPAELAQCAKLAEQYGYDEVNLNVGCPSDRVQNNMIGACLMAEPQLVADCIKAMQDACNIDVTVKHRIGIDDIDSYEHMANFVQTVADTGCHTFIVHARKAILQGLSPKENRDIPPLRYELVHQLKQEFSDLEIIINGGIKTHEECAEHLKHVDGVMIGREAYHNPWLLADVDSKYYGASDAFTDRESVIKAFIPYVEEQLANGVFLHHMTRHTLGLFHGLPGARLYRRHLSENATRKGAGLEVLEDALALLG